MPGSATVHRVNLAEANLVEVGDAPEGFRRSSAQFGPSLGARQSGASTYRLEPGQAVCPYHYEYGEEEWLLVLTGNPWLRTPAGTEDLKPLDLAFFPCGPDGAHQVGNATEDPVTLLMWSTILHPSVSAYPDSDKVAVWDENRELDLMVERAAATSYYAGEGGSPSC